MVSDEHRSFLSFTSTSRSREIAEFIDGNVLFIIDIDSYKDGRDISPYSQYDEEEFLLRAGFYFYVNSYEYNEVTGKWIIRLKSASLKESSLLSDSTEDMTPPEGSEQDVSLREAKQGEDLLQKDVTKHVVQ